MLRAAGEDLGSLCWGIRLSQSKPFHIIGQGHLLSGRSGAAFPTNATQLVRPSILCFTTLLSSLSLNHLHLSLSLGFLPPLLLSPPSKTQLHLSFLSSAALHLLHFICLYLFSFSVMRFFSYWLRIAEVCDRPLYTTLEKWAWSHYTCGLNSNECACVCVWVYVSCDMEPSTRDR